MSFFVFQKLAYWLRGLHLSLRRGSASDRYGARSTSLEIGDTGEMLAYHYLRGQGYRIVARKYRRPMGEIDLVGWEKEILCFIEVKLRTQPHHGRPEEAVNWRKRRQICRVAREYRKHYNLHDINYRFDIVSIRGTIKNPGLEIIRGAFGETR